MYNCFVIFIVCNNIPYIDLPAAHSIRFMSRSYYDLLINLIWFQYRQISCSLVRSNYPVCCDSFKGILTLYSYCSIDVNTLDTYLQLATYNYYIINCKLSAYIN